ncbi:MAG: ABC transporter substrate-binding protein, partial [Hydrogenophaga sp.]
MAIHLRYWHAALGAAATVTLAGAVMPAAAQSADQPKRGGTLVFPIHMGEPNTLDCHAASTPGVMWRIAPHYSTLLQLEDDGTIKGDLARSWKISSDGLSYEFKLHPGIKFHDGSALTSRDVKVSIDRMRNPPPGVVSMRMGMYKDIKSVETPDAETVVLRLSEVNAAMLNLL